MIDTEGNLLGEHNGISSYTVGQRRGLGFSNGEPMYVVSLDTSSNKVIVGREKDLYRKKLVANNLSWTNKAPNEETEIKAKIRYRSPEQNAILKIKDNKAFVEFTEPQKAITPGQAVVFYDNYKVLGGGWIKEAL